jgi:outer membrane murein-binding lipoprotein Lpp
MSQSTENEPTLTDVINRLDRIDGDVKNLSTKVEKISGDVEKLSGDVGKLSGDVEKLSGESDRFNDRFTTYQQATQWVVQLAFTMIASATLTVIITAVFKR